MKFPILAAVTIAVVASPASACRGLASQRYILLETPPRRPPAGAVLLQLQVKASDLLGDQSSKPRGRARISGAADGNLVGKTIVIQPSPFSSCSYWRESESANHVVGFLRRDGKSMTILPVEYRGTEFRSAAEDRSEGVRLPLGMPAGEH